MSSWADFLAKGAPLPPSGDIPIRKDIRDLSPEEKYLYFEGLRLFQNVDSSDPMSYYKISGIHGLPYETWPKKDFNENVIPQKANGGFCTHSSIIFLTWHRPYLALFEAALYSHVQKVADNIKDPSEKAKYQHYAKTFRMPYWDWARRDAQVIPAEALDKNYIAPGPRGLEITTAPEKGDYNPLYLYPFPKDAIPDVTKGYETTVRYPKPVDKGDNILDKMKELYNTPGKGSGGRLPTLTPEHNLSERTSYILQSYVTFAAVSQNSLRKKEDKTNWGGLEDIHNAVHIVTGGTGGTDAHNNSIAPGHMTQVPVSAFDPIFWLHHTNIDRLYALWQALHENTKDPESFVTPREANRNNWPNVVGDHIDENTPLYPLRPNVNSWYRSKDVKRTELFNYTYREIKGLKYPPSPEDRRRITKDIVDQYGSPWKTIQDSKLGKETAGEELLARTEVIVSIKNDNKPATVAESDSILADLPPKETLLANYSGPSKPYLRDLAPDNKYLEWMTNVKVEKHALGGSFSVHVFLGPANDEPNVALWPAVPTHVGTFAPLGQDAETKCEKCQDDQRDHLEITGQIPLTIALMERYLGNLVQSLKEEDVIPYLQKNLHWKVAKDDGTIVTDESSVAGLEILIVSNEVTLSSNYEDPPSYAQNIKTYPEITNR